jgi:hypothetical protein
MHETEEDDGPSGCDVEFDTVIEWDNIIECRLAEEGNEVAADWEKDEDDVYM